MYLVLITSILRYWRLMELELPRDRNRRKRGIAAMTSAGVGEDVLEAHAAAMGGEGAVPGMTSSHTSPTRKGTGRGRRGSTGRGEPHAHTHTGGCLPVYVSQGLCPRLCASV